MEDLISYFQQALEGEFFWWFLVLLVVGGFELWVRKHCRAKQYRELHHDLFHDSAFLRLSFYLVIIPLMVILTSGCLAVGAEGCFQPNPVAFVGDLVGEKAPLFQMGLAVVVLYTISYRAGQTDKQIRELKRTNNFKDYIAHRDMVFGIFDNIEKLGNIVFTGKDELYSRLYGKNSPSDFNPTLTFHYWIKVVDLRGEVYDQKHALMKSYREDMKEAVSIAADGGAPYDFRDPLDAMPTLYRLESLLDELYAKPLKTTRVEVELCGDDGFTRVVNNEIPVDPDSIVASVEAFIMAIEGLSMDGKPSHKTRRGKALKELRLTSSEPFLLLLAHKIS